VYTRLGISTLNISRSQDGSQTVLVDSFQKVEIGEKEEKGRERRKKREKRRKRGEKRNPVLATTTTKRPLTKVI